jgi:hypothetical protein
MATENETKGRNLAVVLADWWRRWRRRWNAAAELEACGSDVRRIAGDLVLSPGELQVIAAKRPDAADLLTGAWPACTLILARLRARMAPYFTISNAYARSAAARHAARATSQRSLRRTTGKPTVQIRRR